MASLVRRARRYANNEMKVHIFSSRFVVLIFFFLFFRRFIISMSLFFESIMLVGPKVYVERHRCVRSLCFPACSFIPAFIDLLPSLLSNLIASTLALRTQLVMPWVASSSNQPPYQYPPPTRESLIQSPPISPLSHPFQTQNPLQKPPAPDAAIVRTLRRTNRNAESLHSCVRSSVGHQRPREHGGLARI